MSSSSKNHQISPEILKFLQEAGRPFSVNDILSGCSIAKSHGKSAIQKSLDALVDKEVVIEKTFGKQKIYFAAQKDEKLDENIKNVESKFLLLHKEIAVKESKIQEFEKRLKKLQSLPSVASLETEASALRENIAQMSDRLERFKSSKPAEVTGDYVKKLEEKYTKVSSTYRKRKKLCHEMIDAIMEGYPKSKKQFIEEVGIETDEQSGFNLLVENKK